MQPFNKYYPPDWTPDKGSVNKFVGKHPLGDRARKIDQGILIVRFVFSSSFDSNYLSTFGVKAVETMSVKNAEYSVISGARKKVETWEPEDSEVIKLKDDEEAKKLVDNALYKLEHSVKDELRSKEVIPILTKLQRLNDKQWADPYTHSQRMRKKFREEKKELEAKRLADEEIRDRNALSIPLLPESQDDIDKVAQLSVMVAVNTKLKTDPFLKDNDWNPGNNIDGNEKSADRSIKF
ncbi:18354_t:CDS:2 [Funneliformis geosporum]|uniref:5337_t:CDS:1 n=1 Tax=Funneliformis geosporum TaxID=1117311 RepID=A0A9W4WYL0_9GLOM|nr:18354_t:CDS:2 [Funneliformis geosporum]CAI2173251.1 5337_t:CDS:2 [Funneliformis geosporum]